MSPRPDPVPPEPRSRVGLLAGMILLVTLGLGSRTAGARLYLPHFLVAYAGDTLWASLVYLCVLFLGPRLPVPRAAAWALGLSVLDELSQLWHPPWLDALRARPLVALVLGRGFLVSDLVCYAVGVSLAACGDLLWRGRTHGRGHRHRRL